jgi:hypothetical protein
MYSTQEEGKLNFITTDVLNCNIADPDHFEAAP